MLFQSIRRTGGWVGLAAAVAFALPASTASASVRGESTPFSVIPAFVAPGNQIAVGKEGADSAGAGDLTQVAQNRNRRLRRLRRGQRLNRQRARNRRINRRVNRRNVVRRGRPGRIYRNNRWYYWNNGYYYDNTGAALAAGIIGLAAGAAIAGAYANDEVVVVDEPSYGRVPAPYSAEWYRQCSLKYRSFRASDGTFLTYSGVRKTCRLP